MTETNFQDRTYPLGDDRTEPAMVSPCPGDGHQHPDPAPAGSDHWIMQAMEAMAVGLTLYRGPDGWPGWFFARHGLPETFDEAPWMLRELVDERARQIWDETENIGGVVLSDDDWLDLSWMKLRGQAAADLVRMDDPFHNADYAFNWCRQRGVPLRNPTCDPPHGPFVDELDCRARIHAAQAKAMRLVFDDKYEHGVDRIGDWLEKTFGVPRNSVQQYERPEHPAGGSAGHGGGAESAGVAIENELDFEDFEGLRDEMRQFFQYISVLRSASLMHVMDENERGSLIGGESARADYSAMHDDYMAALNEEADG